MFANDINPFIADELRLIRSLPNEILAIYKLIKKTTSSSSLKNLVCRLNHFESLHLRNERSECDDILENRADLFVGNEMKPNWSVWKCQKISTNDEPKKKTTPLSVPTKSTLKANIFKMNEANVNDIL